MSVSSYPCEGLFVVSRASRSSLRRLFSTVGERSPQALCSCRNVRGVARSSQMILITHFLLSRSTISAMAGFWFIDKMPHLRYI